MTGRHGDHDGDGLANQADPDWLPVEDHHSEVRPLRAAAATTLTGQTMRDALAAVGAVGKQIKSFDELAAGAVGALRQAPTGLTSAGAAAFLATCAVESAWWRTTTEYGTGQRYAPYIGRTFVQLTWKENYAGFGRWCKAKGLVDDSEVFVRTPAALSDFKWAWLGAVYYFEVHGLWRYANADNMLAVSQAVNGGNGRIGTSFVPNGWSERRAMYRVFLAANIAVPAAASTPVTKGLPVMLERELVQGNSRGTLCIPVGKASGMVDRAYVSVRAQNGVNGSVWFQTSADIDGSPPGAGTPFRVSARNARRAWVQVPDGTEYLEWDLTCGGPGSLLVELVPK